MVVAHHNAYLLSLGMDSEASEVVVACRNLANETLDIGSLLEGRAALNEAGLPLSLRDNVLAVVVEALVVQLPDIVGLLSRVSQCWSWHSGSYQRTSRLQWLQGWRSRGFSSCYQYGRPPLDFTSFACPSGSDQRGPLRENYRESSSVHPQCGYHSSP